MDKVYYPQEIENPVLLPIENGSITPIVKASSVSTKTSEGEVKEPNVEVNTRFPEKLVAYETLSESFNTMERKIKGTYSFNPSGSIQIGDYSEGVQGEIKISPDGILAKDKDGNTSFSIDGSTGNASFKGTIQAETLIGGMVYVGSPAGDAGVYIDGENKRILVHDGTTYRIVIGNI